MTSFQVNLESDVAGEGYAWVRDKSGFVERIGGRYGAPEWRLPMGTYLVNDVHGRHGLRVDLTGHGEYCDPKEIVFTSRPVRPKNSKGFRVRSYDSDGIVEWTRSGEIALDCDFNERGRALRPRGKS